MRPQKAHPRADTHHIQIVKLGSIVAETPGIASFHFFKLAAIHHEGPFWNDSRRVLGSVYHRAKICWNCCSSFDNICLLSLKILCIWLENAYSRPQNGLFEGFDP